jgi:hypothetical protein
MPGKSKKNPPVKGARPKKRRPITVDGDIELLPDAWDRFENLVKSAAKLGHRPHTPTATKPPAKAKKRGPSA